MKPVITVTRLWHMSCACGWSYGFEGKRADVNEAIKEHLGAHEAAVTPAAGVEGLTSRPIPNGAVS